MQGNNIVLNWNAIGGADSYILQRKADSGEWTQVYAGTATSYTDMAGSWSTVQYQVCGVFSGVNGAFAQSDSITVIAASTLVISGTDGDLRLSEPVSRQQWCTFLKRMYDLLEGM